MCEAILKKHCKMCERNIEKMLEILKCHNNFQFKYQFSDFPDEIQTNYDHESSDSLSSQSKLSRYYPLAIGI